MRKEEISLKSSNTAYNNCMHSDSKRRRSSILDSRSSAYYRRRFEALGRYTIRMDMIKMQLLVSLLTIVASGVVSGIVTFRLNSRRDARRLRRTKLEEFYSAHSAFIRQLSADWLLHMKVMRNEISYNDALDIIVNRDKMADPPFERAEILVALYFPELVGQFQQLLELRDEAATVINSHKQVYNKIGPHETAALDKMKVLCASLTLYEAGFRERVVRVARVLGAHSRDAA
jgi:hypothetical protein